MLTSVLMTLRLMSRANPEALISTLKQEATDENILLEDGGHILLE
jgi:hypothetical protein